MDKYVNVNKLSVGVLQSFDYRFISKEGGLCLIRHKPNGQVVDAVVIITKTSINCFRVVGINSDRVDMYSAKNYGEIVNYIEENYSCRLI